MKNPPQSFNILRCARSYGRWAALVLCFFAPPILADDAVWLNPGGGSWTDPRNWLSHSVPGPADTVWITNSGTFTVTVNSPVAISNLWLGGASSSPTLAVAYGAFTLTGAGIGGSDAVLSLTGGTLDGSGSWLLAGRLSWGSGTVSASVQCAGGAIYRSSPCYLLSKLVNTGLLTISGDWGLNVGYGAGLTNVPGATIDLLSDPGLAYYGGAPGVLENAGLVRKSAGVSTALDVVFNNSGTLSVESGRVRLTQGGLNNGTNVALYSGAVDFGGGTHTLGPDSWLQGEGTVGASGGTVNFAGRSSLAGTVLVNGGTFNFNQVDPVAVGAVSMSSGTLGGTGLVDCAGALTWTGGTLTGWLRCAGGTINRTTVCYLNGGRLVNSGVLTISGPWSLNVGYGAGLTNLSGATLDLVSDVGLSYSGGTVGVLHNAGLLRKSAGVSAVVAMAVNNFGTVLAQSGRLSLNQGGINDGTNSVVDGATLDFGGGTHTLGTGSWLRGEGVISSSGGVVDFAGRSALTGTLILNGGTFNFNQVDPVAVGAVSISSGTLGGTGLVDCAGALTWTSGVLTGWLRCAGGAINRTTACYLNGGRLVNSGVLTISGPWSLNVGYGAGLTNLAGATLDLVSDVGLSYYGGTVGVLHNAGVLRKSAGAASATVDVAVNNSGTVLAQSGRLSLNQGGINDGTNSVVDGATLDFGGGTHTLGTGSWLRGEGVIRSSGGAVSFAGRSALTGTMLVNGGTFNFDQANPVTVGAVSLTSGTLGGTGLVDCVGAFSWTGGVLAGWLRCAGGTINRTTACHLNGGRLVNGGVLTISGPWSLNVGYGAGLTNLSGGTLDLVSDVGLSYSGGTAGVLHNAGLLRKSAGAASATVDVAVNNFGTVLAQSGRLSLSRGGISDGTNSVVDGATLDFGGGTHTLGTGSWLRGEGVISSSGGVVSFAGRSALTGTMLVNGGTFNFDQANPVTVGAVSLTSGTLGGTGLVDCVGAFSWTGGVLAGWLRCAGGTINRTTACYLNGGRLVNGGVLTISGLWSLNVGYGAVLTNLAGATLDLVSDVGLSYYGGTAGVLHNAGLLRKSAGAASATVDMAVNNFGTVLAQSGRLSLTRGGISDGTNSVVDGATLDFGGGTHTLGTGSWLRGEGVISSSGGAVSFAGRSALTGTVLVNGGTFNFDQADPVTVGAVSLTSGTLGGTGLVDCVGALSWTGGTVAGWVRCAGGTISRTAACYLYGGRLVNSGVLTISGLWSLNVGYGAVLTNLSGATLDLVSDVGLGYYGGTAGVLYNAGLLRKSAGAASAALDVAVNNSGTVLAQSGRLSLSRGGVSDGTNSVVDGATLDFGGGTHTLGTGSWLRGEGVISSSGGAVSFAGRSALTGTVLVNGGTFNFDQANPVTVGAVSLTSGTLGGSGLLDCVGALSWTGGTVAGWVRCAGGTISRTAACYLYGGRLVNSGVLTISGLWSLNVGYGAGLTNLSGATLDLASDVGLSYYGGTAGVLDNAGLFRKSAGSAETQIQVDFTSTGTLETRSGTLRLMRTSRQLAGQTRLLEGSLKVDQVFYLDGGVLEGTNTLYGSLVNGATVSPGVSAPGILTVAGSYQESLAATLKVELGGLTPGIGHDQLLVTGTCRLAGTLDLAQSGGFVVGSNNLFTIVSGGSCGGAFASVHSPQFPAEVVYEPTAVRVCRGTGAPVVELTAEPFPLACHAFRVGARATDPYGSVVRLDLFLGTNLLASFPGGTGQVVVTRDFPGPVALTATAVDNEGTSSTSSITVTVVTLPVQTLDPVGFQTNRAFKLCMLGEPGKEYTILTKTNLSSAEWLPVGLMKATNGIWRFEDSSATNAPARFYRAREN